MKRILASIAVAIPAATLSAPPQGIPQSELALGGISIDDSEHQVRERLGQPAGITEELDHLNLHLRYQHLVVSFSGDVVGSLFSESPQACTPAGLCPGDPLERAVALYGAPELTERENGVTYWEYYTSVPCWLQIGPEGGLVGSIRVACQP